MSKVKNTVRTTIFGLDITVSSNNIHVEDSYSLTSRVSQTLLLNKLREYMEDAYITMDNPLNHRSNYSLCNEWITHNNAYKLGYKKGQSEDTDLNYPQKWYMNIVYWLGSLIVL